MVLQTSMPSAGLKRLLFAILACVTSAAAAPAPSSVPAGYLTEAEGFVALLDSRYKIPIPSKTMVSAVSASVVGLEGDPAHVQDGVTRMKFVFFDSGPQDRYAEVYINVDASNRVLGFHEKDEDYRKALLLALTQSP